MPTSLSVGESPLDQTVRALPLSVDSPREEPQGDGAPTDESAPDPPEPPERPDFPRIDVEQQAPQPNQEVRNREALTGLLSALGTAFASAGDDPTMLNISSGLTQGSGEQLRERRETLKKRQEAYKEFLTEAQRFNRQMQQRETEADFEGRMAKFDQEAEEYNRQREAMLDKELEQLEEELRNQRPDVQALAKKRKAGAAENRAEEEAARELAQKRRRSGNEGGGEDRPSMGELNAQLMEVGRAMSTTATQLEAARQKLSEMDTSASEGERQFLRDRVQRLQKTLDELGREQARVTGQINQRRSSNSDSSEGTATSRSGGNGGRGSQPSSRPENGSTPTAPTSRRDTSGRQAADSTGSTGNRQDAGGRGTQSSENRINRLAQQQASQVDTVTRADIGAAVERFGEGSEQVQLLRRIRQIQQNQ